MMNVAMRLYRHFESVFSGVVKPTNPVGVGDNAISGQIKSFWNNVGHGLAGERGGVRDGRRAAS